MLRLIGKKPIILAIVCALCLLFILIFSQGSSNTVFVIGLISSSLISILACSGVYYYIKAQELAPTLMEKAALQKEIEIMQNTISNLEDEQKGLEDELAVARRTIADRNEADEWLKENSGKIETLKVGIEAEKERLKTATDEFEKKQTELTDLISQVAALSKEKNEIVKNKEDELNNLIKKKTDELNNEIHNKKDELNNIIRQKEDELSNLIRQKKDEYNNAIIQKENELRTKTDSLLQERDDRLKQKEKEYKEDCEKLKQEFEKLKSSLREKATKLLADTENLRKELAAKKEEKSGLEVQIKNLENNRDSIKEEIVEAKNILGSLTGQINGLKDEIAKLEARKEEFKHSIEELKDLQTRFDTLTTENTALTHQRDVLKGEISALQQGIAELNKRQEISKERWSDLDRPIITKTEREFNETIDEKDWLEAFNDTLEDNNISFNERIIKAFHTSLKCSEISPLVVLAGISGTGKSLLPELYASALGMNYLPVAVQPRWDSPQDMFGFFNYMDGRYKATELSRFLWQLDEYNNSKVYEEFGYNPMNLVLLDEMNLAKVEYYFSDLLSKLETRRGLDLSIPEQRKKAEIELECGASGHNFRSLFVSPSTLFIGTMNEDESTQTLSDKVLDRANVIRFGRPKKLGVKPDKERFISECSSWEAISKEQWQSWKLDKNECSEEMDMLSDINEQLEVVGRPFAHRVWQAIESYISLYPCMEPSDIKDAISDQIEMKILPKLDGLELEATGFEKVKESIENVIEKINDEELGKTFEDACDQDKNVFFKWHGVRR